MEPKRILVVDDEKHMQRLLQFALQKTGCSVTTAGSGAAAIEALRETSADLLLIDLVMPEMDGFQTLREIRSYPALKSMPVIMLTSRGQVDIREQAAELGVVSFFTKPFSPVELIAEAKSILQL